MPELDGQSVLKEVRTFEENNNIFGHDKVKIIMTTALSDKENIITAFKEQCENYLVKPIDMIKLKEQLSDLGFTPKEQ